MNAGAQPRTHSQKGLVELTGIEPVSYASAHIDFVHTLRMAICVRPQDEDGIQKPISTTGIDLCQKSLGNRHGELVDVPGDKELCDLVAQATNLVRDTADEILAVCWFGAGLN